MLWNNYFISYLTRQQNVSSIPGASRGDWTRFEGSLGISSCAKRGKSSLFARFYFVVHWNQILIFIFVLLLLLLRSVLCKWKNFHLFRNWLTYRYLKSAFIFWFSLWILNRLQIRQCEIYVNWPNFYKVFILSAIIIYSPICEEIILYFRGFTKKIKSNINM